MTAAPSNRVASVTAGVCCAAELGFVALFGVYALLLTDANHTGLPLTWVRVFAAGTGLASAVALAVRQRSLVPRWLAWCLLISSLVVFFSIEGLERFNVMMEYETWARQGMPPKP